LVRAGFAGVLEVETASVPAPALCAIELSGGARRHAAAHDPRTHTTGRMALLSRILHSHADEAAEQLFGLAIESPCRPETVADTSASF
jgi:hypothetical protein